MRNKAAEDYCPVLVGKDRFKKLVFAHAVPYKGADVEWLVDQVVRDLYRFGIRGDVTLKSDQEEAIKTVLEQVADRRGLAGRTILEHSPVADSKGNGVAERAVQSIESMTRTLKLDLEARIHEELSVTTPCVCLACHACCGHLE